jgi:5'-nucleotidase
MNILLTNDDGVLSEGIKWLFEVLSQENIVFLIAPDSEKSACSNAITAHSTLKVNRLDERIFSVSGFPADCVHLGLNGKLIPDVDLVVSGINHGPNVGNDVFFSGTVAGARTAYIFGKTGLAISIDSYHEPTKFLKDSADYILSLIRKNKAILISQKVLLNINYPNIPENEIKGTCFTNLGNRLYNDSFQKDYISENELHVRLEGNFDYTMNSGSDVTMLKSGYISITPLTLDSTDYQYLKFLNSGSFHV